jgi:hypothetical protein
MRKMKAQPMSEADPQLDPYLDPVRYLKCFGIEAELVEHNEAGLSSAA